MSLSYQGTSPEVSRNQTSPSHLLLRLASSLFRAELKCSVLWSHSVHRCVSRVSVHPFPLRPPHCRLVFFFLSPCNADGPTTQRGKIKGCKQRAKCFPLSLFYSCTVPLLHRQRVFENTDSNNWHRRGGYVDSPVAQMEKNFRLRLRRLTLRHEAPVLA